MLSVDRSTASISAPTRRADPSADAPRRYVWISASGASAPHAGHRNGATNTSNIGLLFHRGQGADEEVAAFDRDLEAGPAVRGDQSFVAARLDHVDLREPREVLHRVL